MKLSLWPTMDFIKEEELRGKVVVVIDVLRATSVITTAINNGAREVKVAVEIDEALKLKDDASLLCGERKALKIEGFDLANSPLEYGEDVVKGRRIILTTTNGTRAIKKSLCADKIYIGSLLNGRAVAERIAREAKDTVIICAGTQGEFSLDDFICAGKIIYEVMQMKDVEFDDFTAVSYMAYRDNRKDTLAYVRMARHYKYLISVGLEEDIKYCFSEDLIRVVPEFKDDRIVKSE